MSPLIPPTLVPFAQRVYDQLEPLQYAEADNEYSLAWYISTLGSMFDEIDEYASDGPNGEAGWSSIMDVDRAPSKVLPWLAQFVGVTVDPSLSDADQRTQIKTLAGFNRGSPAAIIAATQKHLTGTRDVIMVERWNGDPYALYIATRDTQTPDQARTLRDILSQKPAGISLTYEVIIGQTFQELLSGHPTMSESYTSYATFNDLLFNIISGATTGVARISMQPGSIPSVRTGHILHVVAKTTVSSPGAVIKAALYQGSTPITGTLQTGALSTVMTEYQINIPPLSAANITDYSDLEVRLWGVSNAAGVVFQIDSAWLEYPV